MKKKFASMACGIAAASILSLALVACGDDSPSAPTGGDEKTSSIGSTETSSSSNGDVPPKSSETPASSSIDTPTSSSSELESSSSTKQPETCVHITDVDGMSAEGNCVGRNGEVVIDCVTEQQFKCVENFWKAKDIACPPGSDCDGDGIPDGIRRPDLEPCDTDTLLEFYGRAYQCVENKWVYLPPPGEKIVESASDVSAMLRGGPAVAPSVVKVETASGTITFRDDGVLVDDRCTFNGLNAELRGDTLFATILYPGCTTTGGSMGVITFTLSGVFADVKFIKYEDKNSVKPVREADELLPCGNTSSCNTCGGDGDSLRVGC